MTDPVDLDNCAREPIHIPGSIQPHGCLLATDAMLTTVLRHSANAPAMLGLAGDPNGSGLPQTIGASAAHDLRNALTVATDGRPALVLALELAAGGRFDVAVHRQDRNAIIEFEPVGGGAGPLHRARELIGRISDTTDVPNLLRRAARLVQALLGYDRVMFYQFEDDGAGKVVSEVKRPHLESFLGQYFPASDIPAQARLLYLRSTIRVITDAGNPRMPIVPEHDADGVPLDLSLAHLRSVSPVHCEYLRNMGVAASMSISIITEDRLWGLIACHHYTPRVLPMAERVAAELFGQFFSLHLQALIQRQALAAAGEARRALDRFLRLAPAEADLEHLLARTLPDFARLLPCDGIGLLLGGHWTAEGVAPPPAAIPGLVEAVGREADGRVWSTPSIGGVHPPAAGWAAEASGLLAVPLSQAPRDWLLFFRREFVHTLDWAGDPHKTYSSGPLGDRLTPRRSFAIWKENVEGQSKPWTEADHEVAEAVRAAAVEVVIRHNEMMAEERNKADVRQRMLNEELNHRVKNILAVIQSLVGHALDERRSLDDYVGALRGRIQALAFAHDQVVRGDGGGQLADLLEAELRPFRGGGTVTLDGPGAWLDSRSFSVMALVLHELATNAAKYGALSADTGRLAIGWRFGESGDLLIDWTECDGPPVLPPSRRGFGTALIERSIPFDLGGASDVDYRASGLVARLRLPAAHASPADAPTQPPPSAPGAAPAPTRADLSILLVEDQMLIAMDTEAMLTGSVARQVVTATTEAEARARLREAVPDIAVLDVNLGSGNSIPLAEELARQGVPFVFATGYGDGTRIPEAFRGVPVVRKPYDAAALAIAIAEALADR
jgi:light-regulated signal transduction histidine kinase (bacteriophytochrome)/CheY-like chemotaxis protein